MISSIYNIHEGLKQPFQLQDFPDACKGTNLSGILVMTMTEEGVIEPEEEGLLTKSLQKLGVDIGDIVILNVNLVKRLTFKDLRDIEWLKSILLVGVDPSQISLNVDLPSNTLNRVFGLNLLYSKSLTELKSNKVELAAWWSSMQKLKL